MDNRYGIIDLGSNTFHILIVEKKDNNTFETVHKERVFVGLAEKGLEVISDRAIEKGIDTLHNFKKILEEYNITNYKTVGTAALRSANNRSYFIDRVAIEVGFQIEVIGGEREAELIFKGASIISDIHEGNHIIMDVGGGSVEFILIKKRKAIMVKII